MTKLTNKYLFFVSILCIVFCISTIVYGRKLFDELLGIVAYYSFVTAIIFIINLFKTRKVKWGVVVFFVGLITILIIWGESVNALEGSFLDLLVNLSKVNVPFLPNKVLVIEQLFLRAIVFYLLYFLLPLLYFYGVYYFSKILVNRLSKSM